MQKKITIDIRMRFFQFLAGDDGTVAIAVEHGLCEIGLYQIQVYLENDNTGALYFYWTIL